MTYRIVLVDSVGNKTDVTESIDGLTLLSTVDIPSDVMEFLSEQIKANRSRAIGRKFEYILGDWPIYDPQHQRAGVTR